MPEENRFEAEALGKGRIFGISSLAQAVKILASGENESMLLKVNHQPVKNPVSLYDSKQCGDFSDIKGHWILKRAIEVAATGRHNIFLFGPQGSGKTMVAQQLPTILPPLSEEESLEVTQIHSLAGMQDI